MIAELERVFFHGYTPQPGDVVVEVGAGAGGETADLARMVGPEGHVVAVEPHPVSFSLLKGRGGRVRDGNVAFVNAAVLDGNGDAWISNDGLLLRDRLVEPGYHGALPVVAVTLDSITEDLDRVDFLKMNIEGSEVSALRGGSETLEKTRHIVVSCHDFLGIPTKADVRQILTDAGFIVTARADAEDGCRADYLYGRR